jgi:L-ribulose-5-phosphate 3-epimerase
VSALPIHCMQGRLLPPVDGRFQAFPAARWRDEIAHAEQAGIDGIEWIYEVPGEDVNPLTTDAGVDELRALCDRHGVVVESVCADWFMDRPLLADPAVRADKLVWLLGRCARAGIERVVVPFVDASKLDGLGDVGALTDLLGARAGDFEATGVEVHLETDLPPAEFAALLDAVDHPLVLANYDIGNSSSLGYDPGEELGAYGDRLGSVHIKDRVRGGGTVPLGEGDADVDLVLALLAKQGWERPLVLQVARAEDGAEVDWIAAVARDVRARWERVAA